MDAPQDAERRATLEKAIVRAVEAAVRATPHDPVRFVADFLQEEQRVRPPSLQGAGNAMPHHWKSSLAAVLTEGLNRTLNAQPVPRDPVSHLAAQLMSMSSLTTASGAPGTRYTQAPPSLSSPSERRSRTSRQGTQLEMGCCPSKDAALLEVSHVETVQAGATWQGVARRDNASCASAAWLNRCSSKIQIIAVLRFGWSTADISCGLPTQAVGWHDARTVPTARS